MILCPATRKRARGLEAQVENSREQSTRKEVLLFEMILCLAICPSLIRVGQKRKRKCSHLIKIDGGLNLFSSGFLLFEDLYVADM